MTYFQQLCNLTIAENKNFFFLFFVTGTVTSQSTFQVNQIRGIFKTLPNIYGGALWENSSQLEGHSSFATRAFGSLSESGTQKPF